MDRAIKVERAIRCEQFFGVAIQIRIGRIGAEFVQTDAALNPLGFGTDLLAVENEFKGNNCARSTKTLS